MFSKFNILSFLLVIACSHSLFAATVTWDNSSGDSLWSNPLNFDTDSLPNLTDDVVFSDGSSCVIDMNVSVASISLAGTYTGTVTQNTLQTVTTSSNFTVSGGSFIGGDGIIDCNGHFLLNGGSFLSTSGMLHLGKDATISGGTFLHNSGTVVFDASTKVIDIGTAVLHNVIVNMYSYAWITVIGNVDVDGDLTLTTSVKYDGGTITVHGDVVTTDASLYGTGTVVMDGTGNQSLNAAGGIGAIPGLHINKTAGTLTVSDTIEIDGTSGWTHTAGTVDASGCTISFNAALTIDASAMAFNDIVFHMAASSWVTIVGSLDVDGNITLTELLKIDGGTIFVGGNLTTTNDSIRGTTDLVIDGSGNQTLSAAGGTGAIPGLQINKTGGTLTITDTIEVDGTSGWTHIAGAVDAATSTIVFSNALTITSGSMSFNNVEVRAVSWQTLTIADAMNVNGNLVLTEVLKIDGADISVAGDIITTDISLRGTSVLICDGTGAQTLSAAGADGSIPALIINKASGTLTIADIIEVQGDGGWTYIAGTVDAGNSFIVLSAAMDVNAGSMSFNDVDVDMMDWQELTVTGTMDVNGNFGICQTSRINNGTITVAGDVTTIDETAYGSTVIVCDGSSAQVISANGGVGELTNITINKGSGTLTLEDTLEVTGDWIQELGFVDPGSSTVHFVRGTDASLVNAHLHNVVVDLDLSSYGVHAQGDISLSGDLNIVKGRLYLNDSNLTLSGDLQRDENSATLYEGTSSVLLDGWNQVISGSFNFYNFTKKSVHENTLTIEAGSIQSISNAITLKGSAASALVVQSSSPGSLWELIVGEETVQNIGHLVAQDSDARGGATIQGYNDVVNAGNLFNWELREDLLVFSTDVNSYTSPAWIEGTCSANVGILTVSIDGNSAFAAKRLSPTQWYLDNVGSSELLGVTLDANQPSQVTLETDVGVDTFTDSLQVTWTPIDISAYGMNNISIRKGDSLLLTSTAIGTVLEIDANGDGVFELAGVPGDTFPVNYGSSGTVVVQIKIDGVLQAEALNVDVIELNAFPSALADQINYTRDYYFNVLPFAQRAQVIADGFGPLTIDVVECDTDPANNMQGTLVATEAGSPTILVRLTNGLPFRSLEVDEFTITSSASVSEMNLDDYFTDGSMLLESTMTLTPYISGLDVELKGSSAGVTFVDGSTLLNISTNDFTDWGTYGTTEYQFIKPPLVSSTACHNFVVYQNSIQVSK